MQRVGRLLKVDGETCDHVAGLGAHVLPTDKRKVRKVAALVEEGLLLDGHDLGWIKAGVEEGTATVELRCDVLIPPPAEEGGPRLTALELAQPVLGVVCRPRPRHAASLRTRAADNRNAM